jgi:type I restriction enzyme S subunit
VHYRADVSYNLLTEEVERRLASPRFDLAPISSFEVALQYGCSKRATPEPVGVPILRMNNLQAEGWDFSDLKYVDISPHEIERWQLQRGDIVFNRTNSKELVGKCEVFDQDGIWVFASYLMRLRVNREEAEPDFVSAFLNTRAGRVQIDRESRQIIGMSNINAQEIRSLRVPLPKPHRQRELLTSLDSARELRKDKLAKADALLAGIDEFLLDALGLTSPAIDMLLHHCWAVRAAETVRERRLDPHRFAPRTRKLREMIERGRFKTLPLSLLVDPPVSGDWGISSEEKDPGDDYVECLIIRATEFNDRDNLILDNDRVRFRWLSRQSFENRSLQPGDILLEKSGGGPLQPVGRVALIEPKHLENGPISFSNFVMRLRPHTDILPMYLWAFLGVVNRCGLTESMQAQTHGIRNLKLDEYLPQPIPIPGTKEQEKIIVEVTRRREDARRLRDEAQTLWDDARRLFEDALLGPYLALKGLEADKAKEGRRR